MLRRSGLLSSTRGGAAIPPLFLYSLGMTITVTDLAAIGAAARAAAKALSLTSTEAKDKALAGIAHGMLDGERAILEANAHDCATAKADGMSEAMLDRLLLDRQRLEGMAQDVRSIALLPDPVGEVIDMRTVPNGLQVGRVRVPLGVVGAIYESRPNVTVDIAALCIKSGQRCHPSRRQRIAPLQHSAGSRRSRGLQGGGGP